MAIKVNISDKGLAWKFDVEADMVSGKSVGELIKGTDLKSELEGYELEITGGSDISGFPMSKDVEGVGVKRVMLTKGFSMRENKDGLRKRKLLRGKVVSEKTSQLNLKVIKHGHKKLGEIFPDQNKKEEPAKVEEKKD